MANPFDELADLLTDRFRSIVREELQRIGTDKNGMDEGEYLTVEKTMQFLDCSKQHVYHLKKTIPHIVRGSRLYFKVLDLKDYMERGRVSQNKKFA
jgi:hypothetical protein